MKKQFRLLALCLIVALVPTGALAEEFVNYSVEAEPGEAAGETGAPGLVAVPEGEAAFAPVDEWLDADEPTSRPEEQAVASLPEAETSVSPEAAAQEAEAAHEDGTSDDGPADAQRQPAPHADPEGPRLAASEITLGVGESYKLKPTVPEGKTGAISCVSSDEAVATVSGKGSVKAVAPGDACVTFTCDDGSYAECFVHVKKAPDKVAFSAKKFSIGKGESTDALKVILGSVEGDYAGACTFSSSDKKIVKIDANGALTGVKTGTATVKVRTYNGKKASCKVSVVKAPKKLTATVDKKTVGVGETAQISWTLPKGTASQVSFKSEKPAIASVDPVTGVVTGVAPGSARIRVRTFNKKKKYVTVKVLPAPQELCFDADAVKLGVGMKLEVAASVDKGAADRITYKVKKKSVATYKDGKLKGVKKGKTVLEAKTYNGLTARCEITVVTAPKKVTLPYSEVDIGVKQKLQLEPDVGKSASTYTYSTSDKKVVSVSKKGVIKGLKKGTATITVKTYNKKKVKLKVTVLKASGSISLAQKKVKLGIGETAKVAFTLPKKTAAGVTFSVKDKSVAKVDAATGVVTGVAPGETDLTVKTHNGKKAKAKIRVYDVPEWIEPDTSFVELSEEETRALKIQFSPNTRSPLEYAVEDSRVADVSADGVITGKASGQTTVRVTTNVPDVTCEVSVKVWPAPKKVELKEKKMELDVGETTRLEPIIPEGSVTTYTFSTSDKAVAKISEDGTVVAVGRGTATLTVKTHNGQKAKLKLTVVDPYFPEKVTLKNAPDYMKSNSTLQLEFTLKPKTAIPDLKWSTTDKSIAWVDGDDVLHTSGFGYVVLSAKSAKNSDIRLEFTLAVETDSVTLTIPARTTDVAGIKKNLAKIEAIHTSAVNQIKSMYAGGVISKDDASKRRSMVDNAFKDYAFPWMTPKLQKYWKAENSEGGAKDFKPDRVYYGLPYISGSGNNRAYNAAKALSESRYTDSGKGYYLLNQNKLLNGKYCGNDCSCFVDAAIWGTNNGHSNDRTAEIAVSSAYKTISGFKSMRTGDLICKGSAHVVMFLYYANAEKTQVMIIENGGIEPGTNTVHCMIMDVKYYESKGYKVRRLKSLG